MFFWFLHHPILTGLLFALGFEFVTVVLRFGFKMTSPTHTRRMAKFTNGYRIHHGYPGVVMFMAVPIMPWPTIAGSLVLIAALMLFVSDFLHHAIVLPLCAGGHEFDLRYPSDFE